jgi:predicted RNase H-like HicB family nuclease
MNTIRILHHHEPGYGWSFESPDIPGLTGGGDTYDQAHAEDAARFALACAAEEQGESAPTELVFEHYVPAGVAVAA